MAKIGQIPNSASVLILGPINSHFKIHRDNSRYTIHQVVTNVTISPHHWPITIVLLLGQ